MRVRSIIVPVAVLAGAVIALWYFLHGVPDVVPAAGVPLALAQDRASRVTSLRYDATAGQFIQNWQTPKLPGQCYRVTMTTDDGSALVAFFKLK